MTARPSTAENIHPEPFERPEATPTLRVVPPASAPASAAVRWTAVLAVVAVAIGAFRAIHYAWIADDAYISFRYADHLVRGIGLVFNPGEHVEGYSNFLWTLWCAVGLRLGASAESWTIVSGTVLHAATVALLAWPAITRARATGAVAIPIAALAACAHEDWAIFGTSGLETSLFVFLAVAAWTELTGGTLDARRAAIAGLLLALATLTRPDGVVFAVVAGGFVLAAGRPRGRALAAFAGALAVIGVPYALWKLAYFGDLMPNTYYAKSAALSWFDQGFRYLGLYFQRYGVLLMAVPLMIAAWVRLASRGAEGGSQARSALVLAAAFAAAYLLYVARVGGDFMFARFAIPATPFLLLVIEIAVVALVPRRVALQAAAAAALLVAIAISRYPFAGTGWVHGVVNERAFYADPASTNVRRESGRQLRRYFEGLPVRYAFEGGEALIAYESRAAVAIETSTGLTDAVIAHQPLSQRGRVGHEKRPTPEYLIERRAVHFATLKPGPLADGVAGAIPWVQVRFDSVYAVVLTWDPAMMAEMRRRGAIFPDFPRQLDQYIARMPELPDATVREMYARFRRFYFDRVDDPARERAFRERLGL